MSGYDELRRLADQFGDELARLDDPILDQVDQISRSLAKLQVDLAASWVLHDGDIPGKTLAAFRSRLRGIIRQFERADVEGATTTAMAAAYVIGTEFSEVETIRYELDTPNLPGVGRVSLEFNERLQDASDEAMSNLGAVGAGGDATVALGPVRGAVRSIRAEVSSRIVHSGNQALIDTADRNGMWLVWVAERDACLHCLGLQGEIVRPGGLFNASVTFSPNPAPRAEGLLIGPPRHPNCRCTLHLHQVDTVLAVDALKREARRSVAKGWALPSENPGERLRAAEKLLIIGANLPKSVEEEAARAVRRGRF